MIGPESEQLGVVVIQRALELAREYGLDLVEIAATAAPPVCRIMDYSKFKYEQEKKERQMKKSQTIVRLKQIRLKPHIGEGDYHVKVRQAINFLKKKDKVKINMMFRGREITHIELGRNIIDRFVKDVAQHGQPEKNPFMEGRVMTVQLNPMSDKTKAAHKVSEEATSPASKTA